MSSEMTLPVLVQERAQARPDFAVLTFEDNGRAEVRTYAQLWDNSLRIALALRERGVRAGDRFALLMQNHPEFVETMIAAGILGAVFVPIDPRTKGDKLAFMLRDAGCTGAVCGDYAQQTLLDCAPAVPTLAWMFVLGTPPVARHPEYYIGDLAAVYSLPVLPLPIVASKLSDPMQLMYTSGTTGDPKGILVRHARFAFVAKQGELVFGYRPSERPYTGLSLTHGNAQFVTLAPALKMGLPAVISRKFTKSRLWDIVRQYGCTTFSLLGGMVTAIYSEPAKPDDADNPVRFVVSAGMPAAIWDAFAQRFGLQIFEFYGAMEGGMTINPVGEGPVGSCGRVAPGLIGRVVDEQGHDVPANVPGEIWFRPADGSTPVVEYFNNPQASAAKVDGGWLRSGDIVTMDEHGWVFFQYRKGGGIRHNGDFINPAYLEKVIAEHPAVADVSVFGVPAASGAPGEMDVVAALVPYETAGFDPQSVFRWCRDKLEANMVPSYLQELAELPKTASEKVQPRFLLEMFQNKTVPIHTEQARVH
jgi:crotonobetaine/carnitine-CoA ligase